METTTQTALHDVHTAVNDILAGYETMEERAEPEILVTIRNLREMHREHAAEIVQRLAELGETTGDDASFRGSVNKAVVTMRDWVSDLDADTLPFVRDGEERLLGIYEEAIAESERGGDVDSSRLLTNQRDQVRDWKNQLPNS